MFKFVILLAVVAAAAAQLGLYGTPLVGRLIGHPGLVPAAALGHEFVSYQPEYPAVYPSLYSAGHVPLAYASNYVAYKAPEDASSYQVSY